MELVAIAHARVAVFIPLEEINPRGRAIFPQITRDLVERCNFLKFPRTWEEYNSQEGSLQYFQGEWKGIAINQVEIFQGGIAVDTSSSTEDSEAFLLETLTWVAQKYELNFHSSMIKRKAFVSHLTFTSEVSLLELVHPVFAEFGDRLTQSLSKTLGPTRPLKINGLYFSNDPIDGSPSMLLQIERRAGSAFSENKFFSVAPLSTKEHLEFLTDFEAAIIESQKVV